MEKTSDRFYTDIPLRGAENDKDHYPAGHGLWEYMEADEPEKISQISSNQYDDQPTKIRQLLTMIASSPWSITRNKAFYQQALQMADYEDDTEIVPFKSYFPVYRDMQVNQLRSYFTLRKWLRHGLHPDVSLSYLFVYIYETLMQVSVTTPEEGLELLEDLRDGYREAEPKLMRYLAEWMRDYVVYYQLTDRCEEYFADERREDTLLAVLSDWEQVGNDELFDAMCRLSNYKLREAQLYKKYPEEARTVVCRMLREVAPIIEQQEHHHIETLVMGQKRQVSHPMFASAVFYNPNPPKDLTFEVTPRRKFVCRGGLWLVDTYRTTRRPGELLGQLLHETDRRLRLVLKGVTKINGKFPNRVLANKIQQIIDAFLKEKQEASRPKVTLDFSKLAGIRSDASVIREALLSDEERIADDPAEAPTPRTADPTLADVPADEQPENGGLLSETEVQFLQLLLSGGDWKTFLRVQHIPAGVMMDQINEHLMEEFQDTVLTDSGNGPEVIVDYMDDIKQMI